MTEESVRQLNTEQKMAVEFGDGPLLIVAGAGTGKTTVITERLGWLIRQKKASPDEILALTFTEKTASEMEERVDKLMPYGYLDLWISTFHSFGERVLKDHALDLGLDPGFKILTTPNQWFLVRQNLDRFKLHYYKPLGNPTRFIYALVQHFSRLKDENVEPQDYLNYAEKNLAENTGAEPDKKESAEKILEAAQAYDLYQKILLEQGNLDFGDLIINTLKLFKTRQTVLEKYRRQFKYLLVDEFQDTNHAQYELLKLLAHPGNNLTVCGDDDQSIYKFRGASISNILMFKNDFPETQEVVLLKNYRNQQNILDLSHDFIQLNNPNRLEAQLKDKISKKLSARTKGMAEIAQIHSETLDREVISVVKKIVKLKEEKKLNWNDFAILVRANDAAEPFVTALNAQGLPYQFISAKGLFQKPEIVDLIAYLRLLDNYHESSAVYRILSLKVFNIPIEDIVKLLHYANRKSISLYESLSQAQLLGLKPESKKKIDKLLALITRHYELTRTKSVGQVLYRFVKESGYLEKLTKKETLDNAEKIINLNKFFNKIAEFESQNDEKSVKNFMAELKIMLEIGEDPSPAVMLEGPEAIKIMTVHSAKGLEFTYVFIVNLVDKRFPTVERREQIEIPDALVKEIVPTGDIHLQEERRLFYVAMTRAKHGLYFTSADNYGGQRKKKTSRFMKEIDYDKYVKLVKPKTDGGVNYIEEDERIKSQVIKYELPRYFSFTQLKAFWTCPYQYRFMFILKVPPEPKHTFSFGKSIHKTLYDFFTLVQRGNKHDWDVLKQLYEKNWIDEWYESSSHMAERKEQGLASLKIYYEKYAQKLPKPLYLEKGFVIKIGEHSVRGVIDRVDELPDGNVEIIDYKTGKKPQSKKVDNPEQLIIYALAATDTMKKKPIKLSYHYLDDNAQVSFSASEEAVEKVKEKILSTIKEIKTSKFRPTPGYHCQYCDFRDICEYRQV